MFNVKFPLSKARFNSTECIKGKNHAIFCAHSGNSFIGKNPPESQNMGITMILNK